MIGRPNPTLVHYFRQRKQAGRFPAATKGTLRYGRAGGAACHHQVCFYIRLNTDNTHIEDVRFQAYGPSTTIAAAAYAAEWLMGQAIIDIAQLTAQAIAEKLGMCTTQRHSACLVADALLHLH